MKDFKSLKGATNSILTRKISFGFLLLSLLVIFASAQQDIVQELEDIISAINSEDNGEQEKILVNTVQKVTEELISELTTSTHVYEGSWVYTSAKNAFNFSDQNATYDNSKGINEEVPIIAPNFAMNSGEALEGKYIDERIQIAIENINTLNKLFVTNSTHTDRVIYIDSSPALISIISGTKVITAKQCIFRVQLKASSDTTSDNSTSEIEMTIQEVFGNYSGNPCLPSEDFLIKITASTKDEEFMKEYEEKTYHFSFVVTVLAISACYFTIHELKKVTQSLHMREQVGQRENYAKKLSFITNCIICLWNMCYAITFSITSVSIMNYFAYYAIPAFWFFMISFVFMIRMLIYQKAIMNIDIYPTREEQRRAILRFYGFFYICTFIIVIYFQQIIQSDFLLLFLSGFIWVPQIISNIQNSSRITPNFGFAITQQCLISLLPLYMRGCPDNILHLKPHPYFIGVYVTVIVAQFIIMFLQKRWGPRFLIPLKYRPHYYQYERTFVDPNDLESYTLTSGAPDVTEECIICMNNLRFEVDETMQAVPNRACLQYMQTPCRHRFHQKCLTNWMRIKLECPVCREALPPIEID